MTKAKYRAQDIAAYFIDVANNQFIDEGIPEGITNLKLQKILYFSQAAYLAMNNTPLFDDDIEAWKFGPVVPVIYRKYKKYLNQPISEKVPYDLPDDVKIFLKTIWDLFGKYSVSELVDMTHSHEPWKKLFYGSVSGTRLIISKNSMRDYYKGLFLSESSDATKK